MYPSSYRSQQHAMNQLNNYYGNNSQNQQSISRQRNNFDLNITNARNSNQNSMINYTSALSPNFGDEQRPFAFYSPTNKDVYSPHGFSNNQSMSQVFQLMSMSNNHRDQAANQFDDLPQQQVISSIRSNINNPLQDQQNGEKKLSEDEILDQAEKKLQNYSSIVMQQTFIHHLSIQIFFILSLLIIIYQMNYITVLIFLWLVDVICFLYSMKRSKIEQQVDETKKEGLTRIWRLVETFFSIIFKICLYIYLEVDQYKFYYVPCTLLVYILIRFFFVISKKIKENGPISNLLNESFTWGFKIFFVGQLFLIAIKMGGQIDWSWQDVFWPYWIFFYIMIGANSVFVILILSKVLLKCLGQPVQTFEIKGLFWFFMLSNSLCVNSTLFVRGIVRKLDHSKEGTTL